VSKSDNKIVPPASFKFDALSFEETLDSLSVYKPIEQQISTGKGIFMRFL